MGASNDEGWDFMARRDVQISDMPTREQVETALQKALAHDSIASSSQLSRFLEFVVTKKLDGEEEDIKAYSIAVDALDRDESFDPQESAIVRVAAGRLRQVLALHNSSLGDDESVRIVLEPGSYVPIFERLERAQIETLLSDHDTSFTDTVAITDMSDPRTESIVAQTNANNRLLRWLVAGFAVLGLMVFAITANVFFRSNTETPAPVITAKLDPQDIGYLPRISALITMPDESYPDWFKRGELVDSIGLVMTRFNDYQFLGIQRSNSDARPALPDSDYHVDITARARGDQVRYFGSLTHVSDGRVLWSESRTFKKPEQLADRNVEEIIGRLYAPVASPYGIIFADLANHQKPRSELSCIISGFQYFFSESNSKHEKARACAEAAVERGTRLPVIHAMLTFLYLDEHREGRNRRERDPLEAAGRMAKAAVRLGPNSARAHQALFAFHKVSGQQKAARKAARKSIALNPYDTDILGDYAAWLLSIGDVKEGKIFLEKTEQLLAARPAWFEFYRFLGAQLSADFDDASEIARFLDVSRSPLLAVAAAIGAAHRGDEKNRHRALLELIEMEPAFAEDPEGQLVKRGFRGKVAKKLAQSLREAGL